MSPDVALQGWVAGLVAAGLTLVVTVTWEARAHRRAMLDDALRDLSVAADILSAELLSRSPNLDALDLSRVLGLVARASSMAARPAGILPARFGAPTRWGLAVTLVKLRTRVMTVIDETAAVGPEGDSRKQMLDRLFEVVIAISVAALVWFQNPWSYWRSGLKSKRQPVPDIRPRPRADGPVRAAGSPS